MRTSETFQFRYGVARAHSRAVKFVQQQSQSIIKDDDFTGCTNNSEFAAALGRSLCLSVSVVFALTYVSSTAIVDSRPITASTSPCSIASRTVCDIVSTTRMSLANRRASVRKRTMCRIYHVERHRTRGVAARVGARRQSLRPARPRPSVSACRQPRKAMLHSFARHSAKDLGRNIESRCRRKRCDVDE